MKPESVEIQKQAMSSYNVGSPTVYYINKQRPITIFYDPEPTDEGEKITCAAQVYGPYQKITCKNLGQYSTIW